MKTKMQVARVLVILSSGLVGCGDRYSPSAPAAASPIAQPTAPQPAPIQPLVTAIAPNVGSTSGGGWGTIAGTDFQRGATVRLGNNMISVLVQDSQTIRLSGFAAHAAGTVDVVVTNPGGLESRLTGGYTYALRESFDFNGEWVAHAGPEYETEMRFAIRNDVLVSMTCGTSGDLTPSLASGTANGEFSFAADGLALSGTLLSPVTAAGTIDVPGCSAAKWWADKQR
jgi:hypothetical protein